MLPVCLHQASLFCLTLSFYSSYSLCLLTFFCLSSCSLFLHLHSVLSNALCWQNTEVTTHHSTETDMYNGTLPFSLSFFHIFTLFTSLSPSLSRSASWQKDMLMVWCIWAGLLALMYILETSTRTLLFTDFYWPNQMHCKQVTTHWPSWLSHGSLGPQCEHCSLWGRQMLWPSSYFWRTALK